MGDEKIKVSIIIPHYNQKDCLQRLFSNIVEQSYRDFEAIIIDDCTPDEDTVSYIEEFIKDKPYMHLVQNTVNLRFVRTCNKGIGLAKGEYICLLNSDTEIKSDFIQRNIEILDSDQSIGGLTCTIVDQYGKNWFTGGSYKNGIPVNLHEDFQGLRQVDFIAGTAAFYRRDVFDKIGLFDESFIMYHEDIEFGLRIKQRTDYRICTFSDKLVTHILVPSIPRSDVYYYICRNMVLLSKRYAPKSLPMVTMHILFYSIASPLFRAFLQMLPVELPFSSARAQFAIASIRGFIEGMRLH